MEDLKDRFVSYTDKDGITWYIAKGLIEFLKSGVHPGLLNQIDSKEETYKNLTIEDLDNWIKNERG